MEARLQGGCKLLVQATKVTFEAHIGDASAIDQRLQNFVVEQEEDGIERPDQEEWVSDSLVRELSELEQESKELDGAAGRLRSRLISTID